MSSELERALERLEELRRRGVLTEDEYAAARQRAIEDSDLGSPDDPPPTSSAAPGWFRATFWGSWWRKAFTVVGVFIVAIIAIVIAVPSDADEDAPSAASPTRTVEATATTEPTPEFFQVGSLDIQIIGIDRFDSSQYNIFNEENVVLRVLVRKAKGDEYDFSFNTWTLVTDNGIGIDHSQFCVDCPDRVNDLILYGGEWIESNVYFELPLGQYSFTEVRYEPLLSTNKGTIPFSASVTVR